MKKILPIIGIALFAVLTAGGRKQHIFQTYYGQIDTYIMRVALLDMDNEPCYIVKRIERDSFVWNGVVKYLPTPAIIFYNPKKNIYYRASPDNQGRMSLSEYNPWTRNLEWLNN